MNRQMGRGAVRALAGLPASTTGRKPEGLGHPGRKGWAGHESAIPDWTPTGELSNVPSPHARVLRAF